MTAVESPPAGRESGSPGAETEGRRRVAVTGIGCVTPVGSGVDGLREGLRRRRSAVRRITRFDASEFRSRIAAEIPSFEPERWIEERRLRRMDRYSSLAVAAARMAMADGELEAGAVDGDRAAVQMGSALGGVEFAEEQHERYLAGGPREVEPMLALTVFGGAASCNIAIDLDFTGPNSTNSMSCASGAIALGRALEVIRGGEADLALAGGAEAPLAPLSFGAFSILRAMSTRNDEPDAASRPFDAGRDGFVMGEASAVLLLEEWSRAVERNAPIYAELRGFGTTNDAYHMTRPRPDGSQARRAMELALADAGIDAGQVDHVNAHGSATPLNDVTEAKAVADLLGHRTEEVPVTGTKGYYGHALGASGALEAAICCLVLSDGWIPPTLNLRELDPECGLRLVTGEGLDHRADVVLSNSFGFGGINAALVLRRASAGDGPEGGAPGGRGPRERTDGR